MSVFFGTAGESESFRAAGHKTSLEVPAYTAGMGLDAFEYQCGRGVRLKEEKAQAIAAEAEKHGIYFSLHAPYYISMSSMEEEKRLNSHPAWPTECPLRPLTAVRGVWGGPKFPGRFALHLPCHLFSGARPDTALLAAGGAKSKGATLLNRPLLF